MKIAVSSRGQSLESPLEPRFGRAQGFVLVDLETNQTEYLDNSANSELAQAAGIQTAQMLAQAGAGAVLTGQVGPNARDALARGGVEVYACAEATVGAAVEAFRQGRLRPVAQEAGAAGPQPGAAGPQPGAAGCRRTGGGGRGMGGGGRGMGGGGRGMGGGGRGMGGGGRV
ncbi:MAG: NifB/NifX family molybdenum-iron cluster-binding protein [Desulfovibrionaceae bacterium]|nr:NifB/NifX family molybdenum-iron cluster-binding protein [Desulfovibrionaceae bacterium]